MYALPFATRSITSFRSLLIPHACDSHSCHLYHQTCGPSLCARHTDGIHVFLSSYRCGSRMCYEQPEQLAIGTKGSPCSTLPSPIHCQTTAVSLALKTTSPLPPQPPLIGWVVLNCLPLTNQRLPPPTPSNQRPLPPRRCRRCRR